MAIRTKGSGRETKSSARFLVTTDHDEIRQWVEDRSGWPATVRGSGRGSEVGVLRIDFPGYSGEGQLLEISWDVFFVKFDESNLAFLYQEATRNGERSYFNKLIKADAHAE